MAIARRGTPTLVGNTTGSTSTGAIAVPTGVVNGDGLILVLWLLGGASLTVTAGLTGWTLKRSVGTSTVCTCLVYTRVASSEPASYTATISASCRTIAQMVAYSGTDTTDFVETENVATGGTTVHTTPSLTALDSNDWAFCYFGDRTSTAGGQTTTWTPGTGMTRIGSTFANNNGAASAPWGTLDCCDSNGTITAAAHSYSDTANQNSSNAVAGLIIIKQAATSTSGTATPTGAGTLSATATVIAPAAPTGTGTITALATQAATIAATGAGSTTQTAVQQTTASPAGAGTLTARATQQATASPAGSGTLTAAVTQRATATLTAAGALTATGDTATAVTPAYVGVDSTTTAAGQLYSNTRAGATDAATTAGGSLDATTNAGQLEAATTAAAGMLDT